MTPKGTVTIVYNFDGVHGVSPRAPLIQARNGNFYGTTTGGGHKGEGVLFKLSARGVITVLHTFHGNDGASPSAGLVQATDGNFYGVTAYGGTAGNGVIFRITPSGAYSILYNLDWASGGYVSSTPMQHTDGKLYGVSAGGTYEDGVVYSMDLGLGPFVKTLPTSGKVSKAVGILGEGLTGTSSVSFNGTPATFTIASDTYLKTTVPSGATTGFVTVTTPGGTLKSNQEFRVKP